MSQPGQHHTRDGQYRPPELIASIAYTQACILEEQSERAGLIYILSKILAAEHRKAEAIDNLQLTTTWLADYLTLNRESKR